MGSHREGIGSDGGVSGRTPPSPLRILVSAEASRRYREAIAEAMDGQAHRLVDPAEAADVDIAFVTREVTGLSTKHRVLPDTRAFYDAMRNAASLRWVQVHSAGADRQIFLDLMARGVQVTSASGANAEVVAHSTLAGLLSLARRFPQMLAAQRERRWAPLVDGELPPDLPGQRATVVGWGPIGQHIGRLLEAFGVKVSVVRSNATPAVASAERTVAFERIGELLPTTDWLVLACPLTARTRGLLDGAALALLPPTAHLLNVARGEVVDEAALIAALQSGGLAGAFLDVFAHEPLPAESPLWTLPNVIATPHSAGFSDGNAARVATMFLDNLVRWTAGKDLLRVVGAG
jgi:phosphoglycerate dehydrogenase-like enzyme